MNDTFYRRLNILHTLGTSRRKKDIATIYGELVSWQVIPGSSGDAKKMAATKKSIERDLLALDKLGIVKNDGNTKPKSWYLPTEFWKKKYDQYLMDSIEQDVALSFLMIERFLQRLLPGEVLRCLETYITASKNRLARVNQDNRNKLLKWREKVATIPGSYPLMTPDIKPGILQNVYDGVLSEKRLHVRYTKKFGSPENFDINPLGVVLRDYFVYLVGTKNDKTIKQFALHRFESVKVSDVDMKAPENFILNTYINEGNFLISSDKLNPELKLVLKANRWVRSHLAEAKLSSDQIIESLPGDESLFEISATVSNTRQLRWWILGMGANLEVVAPEFLRDEIKNTVDKMYFQYH